MKVNWTNHDPYWGFNGEVLKMYTVRVCFRSPRVREMYANLKMAIIKGSNTQRAVGVPPQQTSDPCFTGWLLGQYVYLLSGCDCVLPAHPFAGRTSSRCRTAAKSLPFSISSPTRTCRNASTSLSTNATTSSSSRTSPTPSSSPSRGASSNHFTPIDLLLSLSSLPPPPLLLHHTVC